MIPATGRVLPLLWMLDDDRRGLVVRMLEDDAKLFDLRFEVAVLRARFAELAGDAETSPRLLSHMARAIAGVTTKLREMEVGRHYYVHVNVLGLVLQAVGETVRQYLPDAQRESFAADLQAVLRPMLPQSTSRGVATSALIDQVGVVDEPER